MPKLPRGMIRKGRAFYWKKKRDGKQRWFALGSDYQEACRKLRKLKRSDAPNSPRHPTIVLNLARRWLGSYVRTARNAKGQQLAQVRVEKYLGSAELGVKPVERLTGDDVRSYRIWLEGLGISDQTITHVLSDARSMFRWAADEGFLERSPFPRRVMPRIQEQPPDRLTDAEVDVLLEVEEPYAFVIRLALATGLRWGELTRARAEDLRNGMLTVSQTKSGRVRRVPIDPRLVRGRVGFLVGFKDSTGFARAVRRRTGVRRFHVHQLRHTFGCRWVESGGNLAALQQVMGHASITTTQRYARLSDEAVKREAEALAGRGVEEGVEDRLGSARNERPNSLQLHSVAP